MKFKSAPLKETKFYERVKELAADEVQSREAMIQRWRCAVGSDGKFDVFFTQLIGSSHQMRDGYYCYLLIINNDEIYIDYDSRGIQIRDTDTAKKYDKRSLVSLIESARKGRGDKSPIPWFRQT
ncbi:MULTISPECIES: hypothetical protein [unclassified Oleiphilus]|uniref:hypothetical protein n=1 Tax=unclassified Oleiphilus TaxID=2631174 RepID=UPI0007C26D19|nr:MULTISPECIES: hypothetical protein [unclassified Oleiphilus]KZY80639.1 hypothetical protein A3741_18500 [Oleiphilus sp. HI0069]KZY84952.1 hypothetical protein A3743_20240 [Oleiphilus sp. HI0072]KZZ46421.1 hypothetical protein A3755_18690 [Oleiphilus sp. HI0085]KZY57505.1 hypothetical protein A3735_18510 [Oleiphilus sp. HI0061]KZZ34313.1 hypothetical protein A3757_18025 [Oleiphilus sp. HI0117]